MGQHYKEQHTKGWLFTLGTASAIGIALTNESARKNAVSEYEAAHISYLGAMTQADMDQFFVVSEDAWARAEDSEQLRNYGWIAVGAIWIWNVVDAALGWPAASSGVTLAILPSDDGIPRIAASVGR